MQCCEMVYKRYFSIVVTGQNLLLWSHLNSFQIGTIQIRFQSFKNKQEREWYTSYGSTNVIKWGPKKGI